MKTVKAHVTLVSLSSLLIALAAPAQVPDLPPTSPTNPSATGAPPNTSAGKAPTTTPPGAAESGIRVPTTRAGAEAAGEAAVGQRVGRAGAQGDASGAITVPGLSGSTGASLSGTLDAGPTVRAIESRGIEAREQLATEIDHRIDASSQAVASMKRQARNLEGEAQAEFNAAMKDVESREKQLKRSAREARSATSETWDQARSAVAADYSAYAQALMRAEAAARGSAVNAGGSGSLRGGNATPTE